MKSKYPPDLSSRPLKMNWEGFLNLSSEKVYGTNVGTEGAETVIRVGLVPKDNGTMVYFTHSGFVNEISRDSHTENWPLAFEELEKGIQNE